MEKDTWIASFTFMPAGMEVFYCTGNYISCTMGDAFLLYKPAIPLNNSPVRLRRRKNYL